MPCLIVTGHPCSGKSTVAKALKERALKHALIDDVVIVNEESACPDWTKNGCYETPRAEKMTRASLKSAFDRYVVGTTSFNSGIHKQTDNNNQIDGKGKKKTTLIVLDSLNYIKGFRYELHCISKAAGERHGVLWVLNDHDVLEEWNYSRAKAEAYDLNILQELVQRYELPDERNRWDKPLYTIDMSPNRQQSQQKAHTTASPASTSMKHGSNLQNSKTDAVQRSVYNMHSVGQALGQTPEGTTTSKTLPSSTKRPLKSAFQRVKPKPKSSNLTENTKQDPERKAQKMDTPNVNTADGSLSPGNDAPERKEQNKRTLEQQLDEILESFLIHVKPLKEGMSTQQYISGESNALQDLDSITQRIVTAIASAQTRHTGGNLQLVVPTASNAYDGLTCTMEYKRAIALPELRRLRKQYLRWVVSHPPDDTTEEGIATSFLNFIVAQL